MLLSLWITGAWAQITANMTEGDVWKSCTVKYDPYSHVRFHVRRKLVSFGEIEKRLSIVLDTVHRTDHRYVVEFDLGMPSQVIVAELDFNLHGLYIAEGYIGLSPFTTKIDWKDAIFFPQRSITYRKHSIESLNKNAPKTSKDIWGTDDFTVGPQTFKAINFLGIKPPLSKLGIGPADSKSVTKQSREEKKTNIFYQLKEQGVVSKVAYSLWVGESSNDSRGILLFSAIDYRYVMSQLFVFPLIDSPIRSPGFYIKLDYIVVTTPGGVTSMIAQTSMRAKLDISASASKIPEDIMLAIHEKVSKQYEISPVMRCGLLSYGTVGLVFSGVQFDIPFRDIMREHYRYGAKAGCASPFKPSNEIILGSNILSMFYMVFDLESKEVGLAFARTAGTDNNDLYHMVLISDYIPGIRPLNYSSTVIDNTYDLKVSRFKRYRSNSTEEPTVRTIITDFTITSQGTYTVAYS